MIYLVPRKPSENSIRFHPELLKNLSDVVLSSTAFLDLCHVFRGKYLVTPKETWDENVLANHELQDLHSPYHLKSDEKDKEELKVGKTLFLRHRK